MIFNKRLCLFFMVLLLLFYFCDVEIQLRILFSTKRVRKYLFLFSFLFFSFVFVQSAGRHRPTGCDSDSLVQDQDWNPAAVISVSRTVSVSITFKYLSNYLGSLSE